MLEFFRCCPVRSKFLNWSFDRLGTNRQSFSGACGLLSFLHPLCERISDAPTYFTHRHHVAHNPPAPPSARGWTTGSAINLSRWVQGLIPPPACTIIFSLPCTHKPNRDRDSSGSRLPVRGGVGAQLRRPHSSTRVGIELSPPCNAPRIRVAHLTLLLVDESAPVRRPYTLEGERCRVRSRERHF